MLTNYGHLRGTKEERNAPENGGNKIGKLKENNGLVKGQSIQEKQRNKGRGRKQRYI